MNFDCLRPPGKNTVILFVDYHIGEFNFIYPVLYEWLDDPNNVLYLLFTKAGILETIRRDPYVSQLIDRNNVRKIRFYCYRSFTNEGLVKRICVSHHLIPFFRAFARVIATLLATFTRCRSAIYVGMQLDCSLKLLFHKGINYFTYAHATDAPVVFPSKAGRVLRLNYPSVINCAYPVICYFDASKSYYEERGFSRLQIIPCGLGSVARFYERLRSAAGVSTAENKNIALFLCFPDERWLPVPDWIEGTRALLRAVRAAFPDYSIFSTLHPSTLPDIRVSDHLKYLAQKYDLILSTLTQHSLIATSNIVVGYGTSAFFPSVARVGVHSCYYNAINNSNGPPFDLITEGRWVFENYEIFVPVANNIDEFSLWLDAIKRNSQNPPSKTPTVLNAMKEKDMGSAFDEIRRYSINNVRLN